MPNRRHPQERAPRRAARKKSVDFRGMAILIASISGLIGTVLPTIVQIFNKNDVANRSLPTLLVHKAHSIVRPDLYEPTASWNSPVVPLSKQEKSNIDAQEKADEK